jgi:ElaB/YqjD/DUF883 family membrane-anchored ribosome-binding protein
MEPNVQDQPQQFKPTGAAPSTARATSDGGQTVISKVSDAAHAAREQVEDRGAEIINQAKQKAGEVYDQANKRLSEQYEKAIGYGRENPGKTTLIAFGVGVGVGVGLIVAGSHSAPHSRRRRMVEPVMNALSSIARELFR